MDERDRRRFSRINMQWAARLDFGVAEYKRFVDNVSLSGLFIEGEFEQLIGDICVISLKQSFLFEEDAVQAVGYIARITDHGVAIEFFSMKLDSFFFLQAALYSKAVNPVMLGKEFLDSNIFEMEEDLVVFKTSDIELHSLRQVLAEDKGENLPEDQEKKAYYPPAH
ncbi:MAG: PilZ domain-containing protein [Candidatus Electrothrix scaldis]|nr:MAG: PilZ domain-containing protein [Candidatus Electrothrix sp. GW3-3]